MSNKIMLGVISLLLVVVYVLSVGLAYERGHNNGYDEGWNDGSAFGWETYESNLYRR